MEKEERKTPTLEEAQKEARQRGTAEYKEVYPRWQVRLSTLAAILGVGGVLIAVVLYVLPLLAK